MDRVGLGPSRRPGLLTWPPTAAPGGVLGGPGTCGMARDGVHGEGDGSGCDQGKRSITQDLQAAPRCTLTSFHLFALVPGASKAVGLFSTLRGPRFTRRLQDCFKKICGSYIWAFMTWQVSTTQRFIYFTSTVCLAQFRGWGLKRSVKWPLPVGRS